jgi:hypothetical protein
LAFQYHWWDLDDTDFMAVYYLVTRFALEDHTIEDWHDFERKMPHMAYAWTVATRFKAMEQLFVDLRVVPQMLGVKELPLNSEVREINKYEWLKSATDLALYRFSSIRDASLHFVNDLLELGIDDPKFKNLKKVIEPTHPKLVTLLQEIGECGRSVRDDRNLRAHEGAIRLTEDDELFKFASVAEASGRPSVDVDTDTTYQEACEKLYSRIVSETDALLTKVKELVDSLLQEFDGRYAAKKRD